jgi:hypothetical protein
MDKKTLAEKINGYDPLTQIVVRGDIMDSINQIKLIFCKQTLSFTGEDPCNECHPCKRINRITGSLNTGSTSGGKNGK